VLQNNQRLETLEEPETTENFEKPRKGEESKGTKEGSKHAQEPSDRLDRQILMAEEEWRRRKMIDAHDTISPYQDLVSITKHPFHPHLEP